MNDKDLEVFRNLRIQSLCTHLENKKNEIIAKVGLSLQRNPVPSNLLSSSAMNFLLGNNYYSFMNREKHLIQSVAVAKFIRKNNLLPTIDEALAEKYPNISTVLRVVLAINVSFNEGRQPNTPVNAGVRYRYKEKER